MLRDDTGKISAFLSNFGLFTAYVPRRGDSPYERGGMLFVSLMGTNFGFWSRLGFSGQNAIIFSREGLV